ncbi:calponin [Anaeramoeba ignava]|uniref:Calponin n=1 Tax=Anaeramoeba ignava TaxID=1746090 RepID=A0A9Q0LBP9_ANAIG|nr:calponin [Anaeramoeba ignava]
MARYVEQNDDCVYGLSAEIKKKQESKFDPQKEGEVLDWIEAVTGQSAPRSVSGLKDGVLLCNLANRISPGIVKKINKMKTPFMQMENIGNFLSACRSLGVPPPSLFMTVDLYEEKNIPQVIDTIYSLGSVSQKKFAYQFDEETKKKGRAAIPKLTADVNKTANQSGMFDNSRNIVKLHAKSDNSTVPILTANVNKKANQSGMSFGARRQITNQTNYD